MFFSWILIFLASVPRNCRGIPAGIVGFTMRAALQCRGFARRVRAAPPVPAVLPATPPLGTVPKDLTWRGNELFKQQKLGFDQPR